MYKWCNAFTYMLANTDNVDAALNNTSNVQPLTTTISLPGMPVITVCTTLPTDTLANLSITSAPVSVSG